MKLNCDRDKCYFCGIREPLHLKVKGKRYRRIIELHHIKERNEGGDNSASNLVSCCGTCHSKIHLDLIKIDKWYNYGYCYKLKWTDEHGVEHNGPYEDNKRQAGNRFTTEVTTEDTTEDKTD